MPIVPCSSRVPPYVQVLRPPELPAVELDGPLVVQAKVGEAVEQRPEGRPDLRPGQPRADAMVRAGGERQVGALAVDVVAVRLAPVAFVAIGAGDDGREQRALL